MEAETETRVLRRFAIENGWIRELSARDEARALHLEDANWIDACDPTDQERGLLQSLLRTSVPESDDIEEIEASARFFVDQAGLHIHSLFLTQTEGRHSTVSVACILQDGRLITIRESDLADFRLLRMRARRRQVQAESALDLLVTLFEQKVENLADMLEDLYRQLEQVSFLALEEGKEKLNEAISKLARLEDSNGKVRLCLMDTQRNLSFLLRHSRHQTEPAESLREIIRDVEALMSHNTFLFEKINFLMNSTQGFINIEQNQIIKIFSIAAVVFLPPTLVASIYGMNFEFMPELKWPWGYPFAVLLMILSGIAPYWYFKHKRWL